MMLSTRTVVSLSTVALITVLALSANAAQSTLDKASSLQQQGKFSEARDMYRQAAEEFRESSDQANRALALGEAGNISAQLGDYSSAIREVEESIKLRQALDQDDWMSQDFTIIGMAYENLGNYPEALKNYREALKFDRLLKNAAGEATRLNNIGNIYSNQGSYVTALQNYQAALQIVNANGNQPRELKLTIGNLATLYQRLGLEEQALGLYQQISGKPGEMPTEEYALFLLNEGVLYRHLGDPVKALEVYQNAQAMLRKIHHSDGEIRALRNIGIVKTMDLDDLNGALKAFTGALELSQQSSNSRGFVEASLYMGEVLRRLHQYDNATKHLESALAAAQKAGLVEAQWKALYALGQIVEETGSAQVAFEDYHKAIAIIESVRAGIGITALKTDFLADKRDVYDSLIALVLRQSNPSIDELFGWMERSRARTLQDRVAARTPLSEATVGSVQSHLHGDTVLVEFWMGSQQGIAVWITATESGMVRYASAAQVRTSAEKLLATVQKSGDDWRNPSRELGSQLLNGIPQRQHMIVVPDGPVNIPFEVLGIPGRDALLIEQSDVSYLPSARLVAMPETGRAWLFPWNTELVAMGDPPVQFGDTLAQAEHWQPLPASATEVQSIARIIPGRAQVHLGADARKVYLLDQRLEGVPLLHLSTHALVDPDHPERSRILLASDSPQTPDYLFQQEVNNLDLKNVGLVTVSACDTARGKMVAGEGVQSFSQSFLAAGASATITSMWKVADESTASFMNQVYYSLGRGAVKAEALRQAKIQFLRSNSGLSSPRYWAAFVLNGDGWNSTTRVIPWSVILLALASTVAVLSLILWRFAAKAEKKELRMAQPSR